MRIIGISTVRQNTSRVIREAQASDEPTLVVRAPSRMPTSSAPPNTKRSSTS